MLQIIFWVLIVISALGFFAPADNAMYGRLRWGVVLVLLAILGFAQFGFNK